MGFLSKIGKGMLGAFNKQHDFLNTITGGAYYDIVGRTDRDLHQEQFATAQDFAERQFQHTIMQDARNFQENLPATKVERLREAGLHPTLAAGGTGGGYSSPAPGGSMPHPGQRPHALDAMMKAASIASMVAGIGKTNAETANIVKDTEKKSEEILNIQEGIRLSQLNQQELVRRLESGDLSIKHLEAVTNNLLESIKTQATQRGLMEQQSRTEAAKRGHMLSQQKLFEQQGKLAASEVTLNSIKGRHTDAQTEELIALAKLEQARMSINLKILNNLGMHESVLRTEAGATASAIREVAMHGFATDAKALEAFDRWVTSESSKFQRKMDAIQARINW